MTIDAFMRSRGFTSQTGYIGENQRRQFQERLRELPEIRTVLEIGFNAGHSAECFFESCKNLERFVSFDLHFFPYTRPAAEYMANRYPGRFSWVEGDSLHTVPLFAKRFPERFDLIYIDGSHEFENVVGDILNTKPLAHNETVLWMDDYHFYTIYQAVRFCEAIQAIALKKVFAPKDFNDPERIWIEGSYL